jgi:hypothetical protein
MSLAIGVARQSGARTSLSRALSWAQPNDDESDHDDRHDQRHDSHNREQDHRRRVHRGRDGYRVCVIRCQAGAGFRSGASDGCHGYESSALASRATCAEGHA